VKLSIVILCWNDLKVIPDCLRSIYEGTHSTEFEVIVSDNGSVDGTIEFIRKNFPQVHLIENGINLRFAKGNNVGIQASRGEYILILNPDTIIHDGSLDKMVAYAEKHPEGGAFGCRVVNPDGSYQEHVRPPYTVRSEWCAALCLGPLSYFSEWFQPGVYWGWKGNTERTVGWLAGCFILVRGELLKHLKGFDEQFFYYYEDTDLCRRIWDSGFPILYTPDFSITHLKGQSTKQRITRVSLALDSCVTRYMYCYKFYGARGVRSCRRAVLTGLALRMLGYSIIYLGRQNESTKKYQELCRTLFEWNYRVDPVRLVENGEEPVLANPPLDRVMDR